MQPHFAAVKATGNLLFVSGQMALDAALQPIGATVAEQTRECLRRIAALLAPHGAGLGHLVKTNVWLARVEDFAAFNSVYAEVIGADPPARSTVRADLMVPGALVEIEAVAAL